MFRTNTFFILELNIQNFDEIKLKSFNIQILLKNSIHSCDINADYICSPHGCKIWKSSSCFNKYNFITQWKSSKSNISLLSSILRLCKNLVKFGPRELELLKSVWIGGQTKVYYNTCHLWQVYKELSWVDAESFEILLENVLKSSITGIDWTPDSPTQCVKDSRHLPKQSQRGLICQFIISIQTFLTQ